MKKAKRKVRAKEVQVDAVAGLDQKLRGSTTEMWQNGFTLTKIGIP